jgi:hypothetical protein
MGHVPRVREQWLVDTRDMCYKHVGKPYSRVGTSYGWMVTSRGHASNGLLVRATCATSTLENPKAALEFPKGGWVKSCGHAGNGMLIRATCTTSTLENPTTALELRTGGWVTLRGHASNGLLIGATWTTGTLEKPYNRVGISYGCMGQVLRAGERWLGDTRDIAREYVVKMQR